MYGRGVWCSGILGSRYLSVRVCMVLRNPGSTVLLDLWVPSVPLDARILSVPMVRAFFASRMALLLLLESSRLARW